MIKIKLTKIDNNISSIVIKGHALYDDFGKDIVCAALSSTVITSINACLTINEHSLSYDDKDGLDIDILSHDTVTTKIINNLISNLYELERAYPKYVQIKEENNE